MTTPAMTLDQLTEAVVAQIADKILPDAKPLGPLTDTELRIVKLMGRGLTQAQIAGALQLKNQFDVFNRTRVITKRTGISRHKLAFYGLILELRSGEIK